jgi:tRNA pseudouridine55 synthase
LSATAPGGPIVPKRSHRGRQLTGIVLLDKPAGVTSNAALQRVKRLFDAAKAGHTGSLDPLATGMLPICFGAATKISAYLLDARKTYRVVGCLGAATDTGDADGRVIARAATPALDVAMLEPVLARFRGTIWQTPPMYSALKHEGRRLYELARRGVEVERKARSVRIDALTLLEVTPPSLTLQVKCSKGTYVRTLFSDIAAALDTVGHVTALRRLAVEPFEESQLVDFTTLEQLAGADWSSLDAVLLPVDAALSSLPRVDVDAEAAAALRHGRPVAASPAWPVGRVRVYGGEEGFVGVGEVRERGDLVPRKSFAS